ncbi:outer membrane homotrimeric porin [uncultured Desulfovibrio sp.]|uniref:outer membrane homotrimeric porin n=1 Tax=uncultured Desulfovibrio sp. TaxID=167968 RepID=UPI0026080673|nr:outer membrane homotrimeric porin [uncultured Desulfovibrio sp.]
MQRKNILSCLLILLCLLSPGFSCRADAVETKIMGFTDVTTQLADTTFGDRGSTDIFQGTQRSRIWLMMNASENVGGTMMFELDNIWGRDAPGMQGGQLGADGVNIGIKEAYIDWKIPDSTIRVRMGILPFILPGIGAINPYTHEVDSVTTMWARGAGVMLSGSLTENIDLTTFWLRPANDNSADGFMDNADMGGFILPIRWEGFDIRPWGMVSFSGRNDPVFTYRPTLTPAYPVHTGPGTLTEDNPADYAVGWWAGVAATVTALDPWKFGLDFNYGNIRGVTEDMNRSGWYVSALAEYKLDAVVPGLLAWYASGDDGDPHNGSERMPTILGNWYGSAMGFSGQFDNFAWQSQLVGLEPTGTWGVSAYLRDFSFIPDVTHTLRALFYGGTNDDNMAGYVGDGYTKVLGTPTWLYLTQSDHVVEVNFNTTWKVYDNLFWAIEASWMNLHRGNCWDLPSHRDNGYRIASTVRFVF